MYRRACLLVILFLPVQAASAPQGPLRGKIVWVSRVYQEVGKSSYDLWSAHADGSNPRRLTRDSFHEQSPAWSPDGRTIAFRDDRSLWIVNADGSDKRCLLPCSAPEYLDSFSWGRHGLRLYAVISSSDREPPDARRVVVRVDPVRILRSERIFEWKRPEVRAQRAAEERYGSAENIVGAAFSKNGRYLAVGFAEGGADLSRVDIVEMAGGKIKRLDLDPQVFSGATDGTIVWGPTDRELLINDHQGSTDGTYLIRLDIETGKTYGVASQGGAHGIGDLTWNRAGSHFVASTSSSRLTRFHGMRLYHNHIIVADSHGRQVVKFPGHISLNFDPDWWEPRVISRWTAPDLDGRNRKPPAPDRSGGTMDVKVSFSDTKLVADGKLPYEQTVKPVARRIPRLTDHAAIVAATVNEMLKGPTAEEKARGLYSSIPSTKHVKIRESMGFKYRYGCVKLLRLWITDGVALVDFSQELESYGGGSAWVAGISCEILKTVHQFPFVKEVEIGIEGETEDILQP